MIIHIKTAEEFEKQLEDNQDKLVVVDFTASWCGPCRFIGPVFEALSEDVDNKNVVFLKVDVDEVSEVSEHYKVSAMPTFMFFKNKKMILKTVGADKDELKKNISELRT